MFYNLSPKEVYDNEKMPKLWCSNLLAAASFHAEMASIQFGRYVALEQMSTSEAMASQEKDSCT